MRRARHWWLVPPSRRKCSRSTQTGPDRTSTVIQHSVDTEHQWFRPVPSCAHNSQLLGLRIDKPEFKMLKALMARYYEATQRKLLKRILSGHLLHIDETEVKPQTGKGYVWVFTTLEEVVFMYRPTREGNFLQELLRDFHGVLVSDFYSAYDSINCPQQKCLIHLIRDMNQELLNNPYDEELQSITQPFGALLRAVVETVDKHGLKRLYLQKDKQDVEDFFQGLSVETLHSGVAELQPESADKEPGQVVYF